MSGGQTPGHDLTPGHVLGGHGRGLTLREHVLSGARDLVATEEELRRLEEAMAAGAHDRATMAAYARAQARLEHAGGTAGANGRTGSCAGSASPTPTSTGASGPSPAES